MTRVIKMMIDINYLFINLLLFYFRLNLGCRSVGKTTAWMTEYGQPGAFGFPRSGKPNTENPV